MKHYFTSIIDRIMNSFKNGIERAAYMKAIGELERTGAYSHAAELRKQLKEKHNI